MFEWTDYRPEDAALIDSWMDTQAVAMTGIDQEWEAYWNAVIADAQNYPGCRDFCKIVCKNGMAVATVVYGCYRGIATISEIIVDPLQRGKGIGTQIIRELIASAEGLLGEQVYEFCAVIFPKNISSQKAFTKAGFQFDRAHEDGTVLYYKMERVCV